MSRMKKIMVAGLVLSAKFLLNAKLVARWRRFKGNGNYSTFVTVGEWHTFTLLVGEKWCGIFVDETRCVPLLLAHGIQEDRLDESVRLDFAEFAPAKWSDCLCARSDSPSSAKPAGA